MGLTVKLPKGDELEAGAQREPLWAALHQVFTAVPLGGCYGWRPIPGVYPKAETPSPGSKEETFSDVLCFKNETVSN